MSFRKQVPIKSSPSYQQPFSYLGDDQNEDHSIFAKLRSIFQDDGSGAEITQIY